MTFPEIAPGIPQGLPEFLYAVGYLSVWIGLATSRRIWAIKIQDHGLRGTRSSDIKQDGTVKKTVFLPRKSGKDRCGLSLSIIDPMMAERHKKKFLGQADRAVVSISIDQIAALGLEVKPNPDRADPRHRLVVGIPDPSRGLDQLGCSRAFGAETRVMRAEIRIPRDLARVARRLGEPLRELSDVSNTQATRLQQGIAWAPPP